MKFKWYELQDYIIDFCESLPSIIWYAGFFLLGFIVGSW